MRRSTWVLWIALAFTASSCDACSCGSNDSAAPAPDPSSARTDVSPEISPEEKARRELEETRQKLLARGNPEAMKPAPTHPAEPPTAVPKDEIVPVSKDVVMVGNARVDLAAKVVEVPARVQMRQGIVEYAATRPTGKTYESLLTADVGMAHLRLALTMIGIDAARVNDDGSGATPGSSDGVEIHFRSGDKTVPLAQLFTDKRSNKPLSGHPWRMTTPGDAALAASLMSGSLIATKLDPTAVVNATADYGNPYQGPNQGVAPRTDAIPEVGTEGTLIFEPKEP